MYSQKRASVWSIISLIPHNIVVEPGNEDIHNHMYTMVVDSLSELTLYCWY